MTNTSTTSLIVKTEPIKEGGATYVKIKETLQNVYDMFVERTSGALFCDSPSDCKDFAEMCAYEANKHIIAIFGCGWKASQLTLSYMAKGNMMAAEATIKRCMM